MKKRNLKPIVKGGVLLLPAFLLLASNGTESKAMLRGAFGRLASNIRNTKLNMPTSNLKLNTLQIPAAVRNLKVSAGKTSTLTRQNAFRRPTSFVSDRITSSGLTNTTTTGSTGGKTLIQRSASSPTRPTQSLTPPTSSVRPSGVSSAPSSPTLQRKNSIAPTIPPKESSSHFQKLDPQYDKVPKPMFTPRNPGDPIPEPEVYQNVTQLHTPQGTLTLFKDK